MVPRKNRKSPTKNTIPIPAPTVPPTIAPTLATEPLFSTEGGLEAREEGDTEATILPVLTMEPLEGGIEGENKADIDLLAGGAKQSSML